MCKNRRCAGHDDEMSRIQQNCQIFPVRLSSKQAPRNIEETSRSTQPGDGKVASMATETLWERNLSTVDYRSQQRAATAAHDVLVAKILPSALATAV